MNTSCCMLHADRWIVWDHSGVGRLWIMEIWTACCTQITSHISLVNSVTQSVSVLGVVYFNFSIEKQAVCLNSGQWALKWKKLSSTVLQLDGDSSHFRYFLYFLVWFVAVNDVRLSIQCRSLDSVLIKTRDHFMQIQPLIMFCFHLKPKPKIVRWCCMKSIYTIRCQVILKQRSTVTCQQEFVQTNTQSE